MARPCSLLAAAAAACSAALLSLPGCIVHVTDHSDDGGIVTSGLDKAFEIDARFPDSSAGTSELRGTWRGTGEWEDFNSAREYFSFDVRQASGSRSQFIFQSDELEGLPVDEDETELNFSLRRSAGTFAFTGERKSASSRSASGEVVFTPDAGITAAARTITGADPTPAQSLWLALQGVSGEFVRDLADTGLRAPLEDVVKLRNNGVSAETVASFRREDGTFPTTDEIVRYRNHGVSGSFVQQARAVKPDVSQDEVVKLRNYGVSPEYLKAIGDTGLTTDPEQVVRLRNHGVSADFVRAIRECGYNASVDEVIKLRNNGVSAEFVCATVEPGYAQLPVSEIINLRNRGVSAETVKKLRTKE